MYAEVEHEK